MSLVFVQYTKVMLVYIQAVVDPQPALLLTSCLFNVYCREAGCEVRWVGQEAPSTRPGFPAVRQSGGWSGSKPDGLLSDWHAITRQARRVAEELEEERRKHEARSHALPSQQQQHWQLPEQQQERPSHLHRHWQHLHQQHASRKHGYSHRHQHHQLRHAVSWIQVLY